MTESPQKQPGAGQGESPTSEGTSGGSWPRRVRLSLEDGWKETSKLAQTVLDTFVIPSGGFSALAFCWLASVLFFGLSVPILAFIALGGLVLFAGLEALALLAYAYPGTLFLVSLAGGVAPPLVVYWAAHALLGVEGDWTRWGAYPLLMSGFYGSYYYWRFGRVIAATGEEALAFYRRAAPMASEVFGAPLAILSGLWKILERVLGLFRSVARKLFALIPRPGQPGDPPGASGASGASGAPGDPRDE